MLQPWRSATLLTIIPETEATWRFVFQCDDLAVFDFIPGQFITLELPISDKRRERLRSYSLASAPDGTNLFELIIVLLPEGKGSGYLFNQMNIGDQITYRGPSGMFTLPKELDKELCLICTGTGIAPFRSQLLQMQKQGFPKVPITLVFGSRYLENILYQNEMLELQKEVANFSYRIALSRQDKVGEIKFTKGYVHSLYEKVFKENTNAQFYLCGWQTMVDNAKKNLLELGAKPEQIHVELYG